MRISRHEMFREILEIIKKRSTCSRKQVAAIIEKDGRIISTGYAGAPSGLPHCIDIGCEIGKDGGCIRTVHAEANAITYAAKNGIATNNATMYCTMSPCLECAKLIVNSGIKELYYIERYRNGDGLRLLNKVGIEVYEL
ncbi:MAG: dCMP deaminase family protein [Bacilli bacterium]|nr:dCMP deaminase family protein [Bacilli bacterium]